MRGNGEERAALAVAAAVAGAGFASGRELVLFFAQLGWAAWIGIPFASVVFALLVGVICHYARKSGAGSVAELYRRQLGPAAGGAAGLLHALLMALTAAVMLASAGEMGALALPLRHGFLWGAALALMLALLVNLGRLRALPWLGLLVVVIGIGFYAGLAIDHRPARIYMRGDTALALRGNVGAAILLAVLYAALNASVAGGVIARFSAGRLSPARFAALCGALLCGMLLCANAAIARGGDRLLGQAMPTVLLAARWGSLGFWLSALFSFLCAATTLTAVLGALIAQMNDGPRQRRRAVLMLILAIALSVAFGLSDVIGKGYAALGWTCAFAMAALACHYDRTELGKGRSRVITREIYPNAQS